jgi:hypothetical protein
MKKTVAEELMMMTKEDSERERLKEFFEPDQFVGFLIEASAWTKEEFVSWMADVLTIGAHSDWFDWHSGFPKPLCDRDEAEARFLIEAARAERLKWEAEERESGN